MLSTSNSVIAVIDLGDFSRPAMDEAAARFAQRKIGGMPLITRMARRLSEGTQLDGVTITGSDIPSSLLTAGIAGVELINMPAGVHHCERLSAAADRSQCEWVVHVAGNRPFVDAVLIDQLVAKAKKMPECDYLGYTSDAGDWHRVDRLGLMGEVCHADSLRRLRSNADRLPRCNDRSIVSWLENAPGAYHLKFIPIPEELDRDDLRFAIETESDWDDVQLLCETSVSDDSDWQDLTKLVMANTRLRTSMATRNT